MLSTLRDLIRYNVDFRVGRRRWSALVVIMAALSFVSPYDPGDTFLLPPDLPPSLAHPFGTTSRGQDVFWQLTFAIRNTLLFGITVAFLSRVISLTVGLALRLQGRLDRSRSDVDQRHLHRHPAVPDPRAVLFRDARPHVVDDARRHHGAARLGL